MVKTIDNKRDQLKTILRDMGSTLIAYSGGVDSTFLAAVAREELGDDAPAVFVDSPVITAEEKAEAEELARSIGLQLEIIQGCQMENPAFIANPPDRCYHCKLDIFQQLLDVAKQKGMHFVSDGTNAGDTDDYRPGIRALRETGVRSPLMEAGLTKEEIRELSREMGLPTWDKPAAPCLATRIPYGIEVTVELLEKIGQGERYLRGLGLTDVRLRHHGDIARIEVIPSEMPLLLREETRQGIDDFIKGLGYRYVTLDLSGFRSGSLNIGLDLPNNGGSK